MKWKLLHYIGVKNVPHTETRSRHPGAMGQEQSLQSGVTARLFSLATAGTRLSPQSHSFDVILL